MKFIISIILCGILERFLPMGVFRRFDWFGSYFFKLDELKQTKNWPELILPTLLFGIPLFGYYLAFFTLGFLQPEFSWIFGTVLLAYCLGPESFYQEPNHFLFWQANTRLFSVLFWFALCGPIGAVLYRLIERTASIQNQTQPWMKQISLIQTVLDWLPARLFTFIYALAGNYLPTFQYWLDHLLSFQSQTLCEGSGRIALNFPPDAELDSSQYNQAFLLIDRSLIICMGGLIIGLAICLILTLFLHG